VILIVTKIYKSHTITKQQYERKLAKTRSESQVRILQQQEKQQLSKHQ
jgi:hypothetical protein